MPINKHVVVFILFMYDFGNTYSFAIFQSSKPFPSSSSSIPNPITSRESALKGSKY